MGACTRSNPQAERTCLGEKQNLQEFKWRDSILFCSCEASGLRGAGADGMGRRQSSL